MAALIATSFAVGPAQAQQGGAGPEVAPPDTSFQKVTLNDGPGEPVDLAVLPNNDVLHTTRGGEVWLNDADTGLNTLAATLDVYEHDEEGLQSIALDPKFGPRATTGFTCTTRRRRTLLWMIPLPRRQRGRRTLHRHGGRLRKVQRSLKLSRFQFNGSTIDLATEQQIIDVPVDRGICCHVGGDIVFDAEGNLYLSTGDDTNPFQSGGFTPIDDAPPATPRSTRSGPPQTPMTCAARSCASRPRTAAATPSPQATCSSPALPRPGRRSM